MSLEKLNLFDGEDLNEGPSSSKHRRLWHSSPIGAKRYHELENIESQKGSLSTILLKNLSHTKRNVSELIEKNKMAEWLKTSTSKINYDYAGLSSDSGVSLGTSGDTDDSQEWKKGVIHTPSNNNNTNKWKVNTDEIASSTTSNTEGGLFTPSLSEGNDGTTNYDDFFTPRCCWDDIENQAEDHKKTGNQRPGQRSSRETLILARPSETKRVGRSADILARVQNSSSFLTKEDGIFDEPVAERNASKELASSSVITVRTNKPVGSSSTVETPGSLSKITSREESDRSPDLKREISKSELTSESSAKLFNERKAEHASGIAKSLIHLAQLKRSNKNAVAKFLKNLAGSNEENASANGSQSHFTNEENYDLSDANSSNETLKWSFPNSNRKREETLRSLGKEAAEHDFSVEESVTYDYLPSVNEPTSQTNRYRSEPVLNTNYTPSTLYLNNNKIPESDFKISSYMSQRSLATTMPEKEELNLDDVDACSGDKKLAKSKNIREMNTQAALIYLSETLIESAQRAEMLLMQKMKEYNDLVCREPPEKKTQDFTCQVQNVEPKPEPNFEARLNNIKVKLDQELCDKNRRIKQLEIDKKKLRQALKKLNLSIGKKCEGVPVNRKDTEGERCCVTPRSISSQQSTMKESNENHGGEFVQALKIENNLLHTLLKEMKAELDQENATILSLAKKLEMSLGKQTLFKSKQQTDVVRKLEDRLEQQEKMLKQEASEARAVAKYVIMKYKKLIQEYKQKVKSHQETVDKLTNAIQ